LKKIIFFFALLTATAWGGWVKPETTNSTQLTEIDPLWTFFRASELITIGNNAQGSGDAVAIGTYANADVGGFAIGSHAAGPSYGAAFGFYSYASLYGAAVGYHATGDTHGAAVGYKAAGDKHGAAFGYQSQGPTYGAAFGANANGTDGGVAVGASADGNSEGVAIGYLATAPLYGIAIGSGSIANPTNIAIGYTAKANDGHYRNSIGTAVSNANDDSTAIRGTLYLDGGTGVLYRATFGSGAWTPLGSSGGTGDFSSVIFSGGTTGQYLSGDGTIQAWPSGSAYDHSHATNAFDYTLVTGTNLVITRAMGPDIRFEPTNDYQIGVASSYTGKVGRCRIEIPSNSYAVLWTPNLSTEWTNIGTATRPLSVIMLDKSSSEPTWDPYRLK